MTQSLSLFSNDMKVKLTQVVRESTLYMDPTINNSIALYSPHLLVLLRYSLDSNNLIRHNKVERLISYLRKSSAVGYDIHDFSNYHAILNSKYVTLYFTVCGQRRWPKTFRFVFVYWVSWYKLPSCCYQRNRYNVRAYGVYVLVGGVNLRLEKGMHDWGGIARMIFCSICLCACTCTCTSCSWWV